MIIHMVAWLAQQGYTVDASNTEGVIWAIDRHYPGGFNRFVADSVKHRKCVKIRAGVSTQ
jgi:hypothetical protein